MRPLVITQNMTADGSIEKLDDHDRPGLAALHRARRRPRRGGAQPEAEPGAEISVSGSISLCHTLIAAGLVDEYRLWTHPYVQGRGRRLFPEGATQRLELLEHRSFASHVTYAHWAPRKD